MSSVIRPIARVMAIELNDVEVDSVSGGVSASPNAQTDVYTKTNTPGIFKYDGSHSD